MNSDEEYTAIQRAEVLNELRAYLDKSHTPGAYKMMVDALEADANRLAALTCPPSDEEVGDLLRHLDDAAERLRFESEEDASLIPQAAAVLRRLAARTAGNSDVQAHIDAVLNAASTLAASDASATEALDAAADYFCLLSHQLSEAREKALEWQELDDAPRDGSKFLCLCVRRPPGSYGPEYFPSVAYWDGKSPTDPIGLFRSLTFDIVVKWLRTPIPRALSTNETKKPGATGRPQIGHKSGCVTINCPGCGTDFYSEDHSPRR